MSTRRARIPLVVALLGAGVFCVGTSEFMIAGLLPAMAVDLHTTVPAASSLVSAFALGMVVAGPVAAVATLAVPRRPVLVGALLLFALMHLVPLVTDSLTVIGISRVVSALACGAFWAVGTAVAVAAAPDGAAGRTLAVLVGGLTLATVLGVPLGAWIGQWFGWRATFVAVAAAVAVVAVLVAVTARIPDGPRSGSLRRQVRSELGVFRSGPVWLALSITALFQAATIATFTFLAPILTGPTGLDPGAVPVVLLGFGIGSLIGITVGGRTADRSTTGTILVALAGMVTVLAVLLVGLGVAAVAVPAVVTLGAFSYAAGTAANARVFGLAGAAPTLAAGVNVSAFNVGSVAGPVLGAFAIGVGGDRAVVVASLVPALGALAVAVVTALRIRSGAVRSGGSARDDRPHPGLDHSRSTTLGRRVS